MKKKSVTSPRNDKTITQNITLNGSNSQIEISGYVGVQKEGITVNLYQLGCVYTLIASMKTCYDGTYSFTSLEDGSDLPNGTYKVEPVCSVCYVCSFFYSRHSRTPYPLAYDFNTATCAEERVKRHEPHVYKNLSAYFIRDCIYLFPSSPSSLQPGTGNG